MKVLKFEQLFEVNINLQELEKPSTAGLRGDELVRKLDNDEPINTNKDNVRKDIIVANSDEIINNITDDSGKYDPKSAATFFKPSLYKPVISDEEGNKFKLNDIEKTTDFGSSKGSSLGSGDTKEIESIQCLILAYRQVRKSEIVREEVIRLSETRILNLCKSYIDVDVDITPELIDKYWDRWKHSFTKTANVMYMVDNSTGLEEFEPILDQRIDYIFCHNSAGGISKYISAAFNRCKKKKGITAQLSKWCPADIWAISSKYDNKIKKILSTIDELSELNDLIDKLFNKKILVGMSLKMVKKSEDIKIVINKITLPPKYKFTSALVSQDPLASTGLRLIAERQGTKGFEKGEAVISVRRFTIPNNIIGEVYGTTARHGKISLNIINNILEKYGLDPVPVYRNDRFYELSIEDMDDEELTEEIIAINNKIVNKYNNVSRKITNVKEVDRGRLISKYQSLFLAWTLMECQSDMYNDNYTIADRIIENMFHYALSINMTGKVSGRTPRYVRIVD